MGFLKFILIFIVLSVLISSLLRLIFGKSKSQHHQRTTNYNGRSNIGQPKYNVQAEDVEFEEIKETK